MSAVPRPPIDPLLQPSFELLKEGFPEHLDLDLLRGFMAKNNINSDTILKQKSDLQHEEFSVPGFERGDAEVILSVFSPKQPSSKELPALYYIHGGGQIAGSRFFGVDGVMKCLEGIESVVISVEYRCAPEHPAPAALHDAFVGLRWVSGNAARLGVHPAKIILAGVSGGGPIAMGTALLCRNNKKSYACALLLMAPMLDDRDSTVSAKQFASIGPWCGTTNRMAWDLVLGSKRGGESVSELVAPARATDLSGLPRTFIDASECEVFRDEAVALASTLWKSGVSTELHVWPGAYHGFEMLVPEAPVSQSSVSARASWLKRVINSQ